ncbi:uncharacterized protein [Mytilus edulis]|uniref:uncharacterized protein n=1 Tax=Mytilus edulis TaxID=6550 RepID=UPI0039EE29EF
MTNKGVLQLICSKILAFLLVLLIKDSVCHALHPQNYPTGITAHDAQAKCGIFGLVNDPLILTQLPELYDQEFWTGLGIFTQLTPWIETRGYILLNNKPSTEFTKKSVGLCQKECSTEYFGYYKDTGSCFCLDNNEIQLTETESILSDSNSNVEKVLVYKIYNGKLNIDEAENGLCSTLVCIPPHDKNLVAAHCEGTSSIKGVCEDGMPLTLVSNWNIHQNEAFTNCWNQNKLLLNASGCDYFASNLKSTAWTNVFREEIEVERPIDDGTELPTFCMSANISKSDKREDVLNLHRQNCSAKLEWFVCKNDSTTNRNKNHADLEKASHYGVLAGGSVSAAIVLLVIISVIVCKVRRIGIFKRNNSANTTTVVFTKSVNDDKTKLRQQTQQQFNQSYGLVNQITEKNNKTNDSYAQVQKVEHLENTYAESSNGEYDHLHNIGRRLPKASENSYDSNAGVRNRNDPTYDTVKSSTRVETDNTYDHSFTNTKTYSDYDVSDPSMLIDRTNQDVYDHTC